MNFVNRLLLNLLPWIPGILGGLMAAELRVMEGNSLLVPCHYEPQYASSVKYWCKGKMREFCTSLARTDDPVSVSQSEDRVSIFDDPIQQVFTVTMQNLKEEDSGWYMCGVELGGFWQADVNSFTYVTVISGMSVKNGRVSEEEGRSVTVQCFYSPKFRESEKMWCRSGDWSNCLMTSNEGTYDDSSVAINDDKTGTLTITIKNLQRRDMGWYWCAVGQEKIPVHIQVFHRPSTTSSSGTTTAAMTGTSQAEAAAANQSFVDVAAPKLTTKDGWKCQIFTVESVMFCGSFMLVVALAILANWMWKRDRFPKQRQIIWRTTQHMEDKGIMLLNKKAMVE
ncbi:polymeric immunoglobulin receptor [Stigmatopora nigra]